MLLSKNVLHNIF